MTDPKKTCAKPGTKNRYWPNEFFILVKYERRVMSLPSKTISILPDTNKKQGAELRRHMRQISSTDSDVARSRIKVEIAQSIR